MTHPTTDPVYDAAGLIPVIAQHHATGAVLMVAWANAEAVQKSRDTGWLHFWSRSRKALWLKGESSGNRLAIRELILDCDRDALLAKVEPEGPACHTGEPSCFFHPLPLAAAAAASGTPGEGSAVLARLFEVLEDRKKNPVEKSYTSYLFEQGLDKILKKVGEEATEVVIAAKNPDREVLVSESADLLYHLLVLFVEKGVDLANLHAELEKRAGAPRREKPKRET